ncbi:MAG: YceI family protein [Vicingus serpentipes]|nr:YceI family protein [Vicingus serpentipes]
MRKIFLPFVLISMIILSSCGEEQVETTEVEETTSTCFYTFNVNTEATVNWTAFKTSEKIGVGGRFDEVYILGSDEKSTKITDILKTIKFTIKTASINTDNKERDDKIINSFFGTMITSDLILGQIKSAEGDNNKGTCVAFLTLNNVEKEVNLNYSMEDNVITLTGEIDINNWDGKAALTALNEVCGDLHKGEDGESITWPNVELNIQSSFRKDCH